jgi:arsenate reductase-like glutaredoxin family protein
VRSATKEPVEGDAALELLDGVTQLRVAKGKKVVDVDLGEDRPTDEELLALLLGRSGKLRAPTIRTGDTLLVGFHLGMFEEALL